MRRAPFLLDNYIVMGSTITHVKIIYIYIMISIFYLEYKV